MAVASMQKAPPRVDATQGLLFYLASYAATVIGAFGVVAVIERRLALSGNSDDLSSWSGLSERHPGLAAAMSLFMISLAGVRVPVLLVRTAELQGRHPAVVALHGLGGNKEGLTSYLEGLARRGILGVALDARYHGERSGESASGRAELRRPDGGRTVQLGHYLHGDGAV